GVPQSVCECCRSIWKRLLGSRSASDPTHAAWLSHRQRVAELDENSCADRPWRARGGPETGARSQLAKRSRRAGASRTRSGDRIVANAIAGPEPAPRRKGSSVLTAVGA